MPLTDAQFTEAIECFERAIVVVGICKGVIGKTELIPIRRGKLANTAFGIAIGSSIEADKPLAIDYYGYTKRSSGFFEMCKSVKTEFSSKQVKMIEAPIVHFASLRIEDIATICSASEVIAEFPRLKGEVLLRRGFKK